MRLVRAGLHKYAKGKQTQKYDDHPLQYGVCPVIEVFHSSQWLVSESWYLVVERRLSCRGYVPVHFFFGGGE